MNGAAILLAGGSGSRMRGSVSDKTLFALCGKPVIAHSVKAFADSGKISSMVFVCKDSEQAQEIKKIVEPVCKEAGISIFFARGGLERQDSVLSGLHAVPASCEYAFIHDSARPLVGAQNVIKLSEAAERDGAAVLASRVVDTVKRAPKNKKTPRKCKLEDLDRSRLWAMQTPQAFKLAIIRDSYEFVKKNGLKVTDDVGAATECGHKVTIVENLLPNPKITVPEDIAYVEFLIRKR